MDPPKVTPEVEAVSSLLAHPLLQDKKFVFTAIILFLSLILYSVLKPSQRGRRLGRRSGPPTVLLVGSCDAGKTALYAQITQGIYPPTHTSIESSTKTFPLTSPDDPSISRQVKLVDLPGHPRLRDEIKSVIEEASLVVFVVDIAAVVRTASSVAEQIPPILLSLASAAAKNPSLQPPKILFLAHKSDLLNRSNLPTSSTLTPPNISPQTRNTAVERLKSILTREMDKLKSARSNLGGKIEGMSSVSGSGGGLISKITGSGGGGGGEEEKVEDETLIWGGRDGFKWEDVEGVEIDWAASALGVVKTDKEKARERGKGKETEGENVEGDKIVEEGDGLDELKRYILEL